MVLEYFGVAKHKFFSVEERHQMRLDLSVPETTLVWLAGYSGSFADWRAWYTTHKLALAISPSQKDVVKAYEIHGFIATLILGHVAIQLLEHRLGEHHPAVNTVKAKARALENAAIQIFPVASDVVSWPPPLMLDETVINVFGDRFST